ASRGAPAELVEAAREPSHAEAKQNRRASPRRPPSGRSRKPSHAVAKQKARDAADADTTPGLPAAPSNPKQHDQTDPTGRSHSDGASVTEGSLRPDEGCARGCSLAATRSLRSGARRMRLAPLRRL